MNRELKKLIKAKVNYDSAFTALEAKVKDLCDFEAGLEELPGDGFCVINVATSNLCRIEWLMGRSREVPMTEEEHEKYCI